VAVAILGFGAGVELILIAYFSQRILAPSWSSVMALSIGMRSRSILNGTQTVPLQHSDPI
jgi:hypothetical protein